jgi:predicted nucleic acid-binding protein
MKGKFFVDTNIFIYLKLKDEKSKEKRLISSNLLKKIKNRIIISTQVVNEFYSVMLRNSVPDSKIQEMVRGMINIAGLSFLTLETIMKGWQIRDKYRYSIWDSLIIASASENDCEILYTEDLQHRQLIENKLRIINPFKNQDEEEG